MFSAYVDRNSDISTNLKKGLEFINWRDIVKSDMNVYVKPNFTIPAYTKGVSTSPILLDKLLGILKDRASKVTVVESDGGSHSFSADTAFEGHNLEKISSKNGASLQNLSKLPSKRVGMKILSKTVSLRLPAVLLNDSDLLVSVPSLKVHAMTRVTLSLKNLWGCIPDTMRSLEHPDIERKLAMMIKVLKVRLAIIDGTYALDRHGPMYGIAIRRNTVVASDNPVVADALGASLLTVKPRSVSHIKVAEDAGMGHTDLSRIRINGEWDHLRLKSTIRLTPVDILSILPFKYAIAAKLVAESPFTPILRTIAGVLKNQSENIDFQSYSGDRIDFD